MFDAGRAGVVGVAREVVGDATLRGDESAVADGDMSTGADLSCEDAVAADFG